MELRLRAFQADGWKGFAISADLRVRSSVNTHRTQEQAHAEQQADSPVQWTDQYKASTTNDRQAKRACSRGYSRKARLGICSRGGPQKHKFRVQSRALLTSEDLTVQGLLDIVHHQIEKLIVSLQDARNCDRVTDCQ